MSDTGVRVGVIVAVLGGMLPVDGVGLASAGATNAILVTLLIPVTAILLGALFLDERLQWLHFLGMAVIALGLSVIDGRLWHRSVRTR